MKAVRLLSLSAPQCWLALSTMGLIPIYALAIRWRLYRPSTWPFQAPWEAKPQCDVQEAMGIATLVNAAARHMPWRVSCLVRSLVLVRQLERRRITAVLRIGVRSAAGKLEAHAWVEHRGVPVNDHSGIAEEFPPIDAKLPTQPLTFP